MRNIIKIKCGGLLLVGFYGSESIHLIDYLIFSLRVYVFVQGRNDYEVVRCSADTNLRSVRSPRNNAGFPEGVRAGVKIKTLFEWRPLDARELTPHTPWCEVSRVLLNVETKTPNVYPWTQSTHRPLVSKSECI